MKTYEITGPDGKTYEVTAPDDATQEQVLEYVKKQAGAQTAPDARGVLKKQLTSALEDVQAFLGPEAAEARLAGFQRGLRNVWEGFNQPFHGPEYDQRVMAEREAYRRGMSQDSPMLQHQAAGGEIVGETAPYLILPQARAAAPFWARLGASAAGGAAIGGSQFVEPQAGQNEWLERAKRAGYGAASSAAVTGALEVPRMIGSRAAAGAIDPSKEELLRQSEKFDVPLTYADVRGGGISRIDPMLESVPIVGQGAFRVTQQTKAQKAAELFSRDLSDKIPGDWESVARTSLTRRLDALKRRATILYDRVASKADPLGALATPKTLQKIDDLISQEGLAVMPDERLMATLTKMKEGLAKGGNFSQLRDFRSNLSSMIEDYYTGSNALIGERGVGKLQALRQSLNNDMADFATQKGGDILGAWKTADAFYKTKVIPFRDEALLRHLAKETDPTASYRLFLSAAKQKPDVIYSSLGSGGKAAIRSGMVKDALEGAMSEKGFSPAKFAKALEGRQNEIGVFFKGADKAEINGLTRLMRHAERAGQYAENPPTGNRLLPWLIGGAVGVGALTSPKTVAVAGSGVYLLNKLMTSRAGKEYLLAASRVEPGSKAMQQLIDVYAPRFAAVMAQEED